MNKGLQKNILQHHKKIFLHTDVFAEELDLGIELRNVFLYQGSDGTYIVIDPRKTIGKDTKKPHAISSQDLRKIKIGSSIAIKEHPLVKEDGYRLYSVIKKESATNLKDYGIMSGASIIKVFLEPSSI